MSFFKADANILAGRINNTLIGDLTPSTVVGTTITANTGVVSGSVDSTSALLLGTVTATSVSMGKLGFDTSVKGNLLVNAAIDTIGSAVLDIAGGALTTGVSLGAGANVASIILGNAANNVEIMGNLTVAGTTTSVESTNVLYTDPTLYIGAGYTSGSSRQGGFVVNNSIVGSAVTTVEFTSSTEISVASHGFVAGDFIQVSGAADVRNEGVYEVDATTTPTSVVVRTSGQVNFCQTQLFPGVDIATLVKVNLAVLQAGTDGKFEVGFASNSADLLYDDLITAGTGVETSAGSTADNTLVRWDGASGRFIQYSSVLLDDASNLSGVADFKASGNMTAGSKGTSTLQLLSGSKDLLASSKWYYGNWDQTATGSADAGFVLNYETLDSVSIASGGFSSTSQAVVVDSTAFTAGKFLAVSEALNPANDGIYELAAPSSGTSVDISATPTHAFCKTAFVASADSTAKLSLVSVSVIKTSSAGVLQNGHGSTASGLVFKSVALVDGSYAFSVENLTAVGGSSGNSPVLSTDTTFLNVTGTGTAAGVLASGLVDGQRKAVVIRSLAAGSEYQLSATMLEADGAPGAAPASKVLKFTSPGQSAHLTWSAASSGWFIMNAGAEIL